MTARTTVFVTGVAGFVGLHMAKRLLGEGYSVVGIDNLNDYYDVALKEARLEMLSRLDGFEFHRIDLTDYEAVSELIEQCKPECVLHLAAQAGVRYSIENPRAYVNSNLDGFLSVLEACRAHPVKHLIYASSSSVYGQNTKVPFEEDDPVLRPVSLYAATKRANEMMAQAYSHLYPIPATGLRFFTVYGPYGRPDMAYFSFTKAILEGRPITVYNHGKLERDFTYIDDIVESIVRLMKQPPETDEGGAAHRILNIGNNKPVELDRFIKAIESACGKTAERINLPMQPGDVHRTYASIDKLSALTGFAPRTSIEDGISRFVEWYRAYYAV